MTSPRTDVSPGFCSDKYAQGALFKFIENTRKGIACALVQKEARYAALSFAMRMVLWYTVTEIR